jgi:diacylglycerol O-acyltransferase / trehalose O-mycolyltransferase
MSILRSSSGVLALLAAALIGCGCGSGGADGDKAVKRTAENGAQVVHERRVAPRQLDLTIDSPALGATAQVRLLTPRGWSPAPRRRWPVLYLLHGCCDSYVSWTRSTDVEDLPQLRDVLVVMPEGGDVGFYSDWLDGPAWQDFHLGELPAILERRYGAGTRRAIAGLSMGGLGAMVYGARQPRMFRAAASFSGVLHPLGDTDFWLGLFSSFTSDPFVIWGDPERDRRQWERHDPTELAAQLRGIPLFVSSGDGDPGPYEPPDGEVDPIEQVVHRESRAFVRRLHELAIPVEADFYGAGAHDWPYFGRELERALPLLLGPLGVRVRDSAAP